MTEPDRLYIVVGTEHCPLTGGAAYTLWDRGSGAKPHRWKRVTAVVWLLREHGLVTLRRPRLLGDFFSVLWTVTPRWSVAAGR